MPPDPKRVESVFHQALGQADPAAYVTAACGGDAELAERVGRLLAAHRELHASSDPAARTASGAVPASPTAASEPPEAGHGTVVAGRYKLLQLLGAGGMGAVWMAEQQEPVKRLVALKLVRPGMDSAQVVARFGAE